MNGSGTSVICLFNALEARREAGLPGSLRGLAAQQAHGRLDHRRKAIGEFQIAGRIGFQNDMIK
jgi:hypothetical protein